MKKSARNLLAIIAVVLVFTGCSKKNYLSKDAAYVPFTRELKNRIINNNIDMKKVQFFIDQKLILTRVMGTQKAEVNSGVVKFENGQYINEVVIPAFTPGVCEMLANDKMMVSFEKENNTLEFGTGGDGGNNFSLYAKNWNNSNGTADVTYDHAIYRVQCATCSTAGAAKLMVIKTETDKWEKKSRIVEGRKVEN